MTTRSPAASTSPQDRYWCFLSYRHADNKAPGRQWATWLHQVIETYEVPQDLVGRKNAHGDEIPARIFPVFRDEDELPADADLASPIYRALDRSRCLVVLCSPRAVGSTYVANEIAYFKKIGRAERTMAALIAGEPNASWDLQKRAAGIPPEAECFPMPLRHPVKADGTLNTAERAEPIAPDFRLPDGSEGWTSPEAYRQTLAASGTLRAAEIDKLVKDYQARTKLATLKIIAGVLGVSLGELTQRDAAYQLEKARARARLQRRWLMAVGALALLACAGGLFAWRQRAVAIEQRQIAVQRGRETEEALQRSRRSLSQVDLEKALALSEPGRGADALMHLDRALRYDPQNQTALQNVAGLLLSRSWPLPIWRVAAGTNRIVGAEFLAPGARVALWDSADRMQVVDFLTGAVAGGAVAWPDDVSLLGPTASGRRLVARGRGGALLLLDAATGAVLQRRVLDRAEDRYLMCRISDDRRRVAVVLPERVHVYDAETLDLLLDVEAPEKDRPAGVHFDPSGSRILLEAEEALVVWDYGQKPPRQRRLDVGSYIASVAISPDSRWIVVSGGKTATFDGESLAAVRRFSDLPPCTALEFSPSGTFLVGVTMNGGVDIRLNSERDLRGPDLSRAGQVRGLAFSPDAQYLATFTADRIAIWDVLGGFRPIGEPIPVEGDFLFRWSADANSLLVASSSFAARWDLRRGSMLRRASDRTFGDLYAMNVQPAPERHAMLLQTLQRGTVVWDTRTEKPRGPPIPHEGFIQLVSLRDATRTASPLWSSDGTWLLTVPKRGEVVPVAVDTGRPLRGPVPHTAPMELPQISPDDRLLLTQEDDDTLLLTPVRGGPSRAIAWDGGLLTALAFSSDGRTAYAASTLKGLQRFDVESGAPKEAWDATPMWITDVLPLKHTPQVILACHDTVLLVDENAGRVVAAPMQHGGKVTRLCLSSDERFLYTASDDRAVHLWDLRAHQRVGAALVVDAEPLHLTLTRDNRLLLALTDLDRVYIWDARTGRPAQAPFDVPRGAHYVDLDGETGDLTLAHQHQVSTFNLGHLGTRETASYDALRPLALALAQKSLDEDDHAVPVQDPVGRLLGLRAVTGQPPLVAWFLADRGTRSISPYDSTPVRDWIAAQLESRLTDGIFEARALDHGDPLILGKLAVELAAQTQSVGFMGRPEEADVARLSARCIMDHLLTRFPDHPDVKERARVLDYALEKRAARLAPEPPPAEAPAPRPSEDAKPRRVPPPRDTSVPPDATLWEAATNANAQLPRMVDDMTRYDRAEVYGKTLRFCSTIVTNLDSLITADDMAAILRRVVLAKSRTDSNTLTMLRAGYAFEHYYVDHHGDFLASILVTPAVQELDDALGRLAYALQASVTQRLPEEMRTYARGAPPEVPEDEEGTRRIADAFQQVDRFLQGEPGVRTRQELADARVAVAHAAYHLGMEEASNVAQQVTMAEAGDVVARLAERGRKAWGDLVGKATLREAQGTQPKPLFRLRVQGGLEDEGYLQTTSTGYGGPLAHLNNSTDFVRINNQTATNAYKRGWMNVPMKDIASLVLTNRLLGCRLTLATGEVLQGGMVETTLVGRRHGPLRLTQVPADTRATLERIPDRFAE